LREMQDLETIGATLFRLTLQRGCGPGAERSSVRFQNKLRAPSRITRR
jgi:hypothetical protein